MSFQDVVLADESEDKLLNFREVHERSGHSTYRILVKNPEGYENEKFKTTWNDLALLGCTYEVAKKRWIAIDVSPLRNVYEVYAILEEGERVGVWTFEEGHCGHQVQQGSVQ